MRIPLSAIFFSLVLTSMLSAQQLLGVDLFDGNLVEIDANTGRASLIGNTGRSRYDWQSLAVDSQGRLYGGYGAPIFQKHAIYEIDPNTGHATFVCQTDLDTLSALAFGPGDVLYANAKLTFSGPYQLRTIDLATGQTTLIGDTGLQATGAMDWYGDTLWIWDLDFGLMTLDPQTAQPTDVNPNFIGPQAPANMAFRPDGTLYLQEGMLMVVDPQTGIPAYVGFDQWRPGGVSSIEWLEGPNPAPPALGVRGRRGDLMSAHATGMTPYGKVLFAYSVGAGGPTLIPPSRPCAGTLLELRNPPTLAFLTLADFQGRAHTPTRLAPWFRKGRVHLQALDLTTCRTTNPLQVMY